MPNHPPSNKIIKLKTKIIENRPNAGDRGYDAGWRKVRKHHLLYNPNIGKLIWKKSANKSVIGKEFGLITKMGYRYGSFQQKGFFAHRLIWLFMTGDWPKNQIDHINTIKDDNRFINLREADDYIQQCNRPKQKNNTSGYKGVSFNKNSNKWISKIYHRHQQILLGYFDTKEQAYKAYCNKAIQLRGSFARL
jgi:hypothetical protein